MPQNVARRCRYREDGDTGEDRLHLLQDANPEVGNASSRQCETQVLHMPEATERSNQRSWVVESRSRIWRVFLGNEGKLPISSQPGSKGIRISGRHFKTCAHSPEFPRACRNGCK